MRLKSSFLKMNVFKPWFFTWGPCLSIKVSVSKSACVCVCLRETKQDWDRWISFLERVSTEFNTILRDFETPEVRIAFYSNSFKHWYLYFSGGAWKRPSSMRADKYFRESISSQICIFHKFSFLKSVCLRISYGLEFSFLKFFCFTKKGFPESPVSMLQGAKCFQACGNGERTGGIYWSGQAVVHHSYKPTVRPLHFKLDFISELAVIGAPTNTFTWTEKWP